MSGELELWQLLVFSADAARGNPTGVLFTSAADLPMQRVAALLGFPDTIFLTPGADGEWSSRTFSPVSELSYCVQTLIGASAVLRSRDAQLRGRDVRIQTTHSTVAVGPLPDTRPDVGWVKHPYDEIAISGPPDRRVADSGRRRLYVRVADEAALRKIAFTPEQVMHECRAANVDGICSFTVAAPPRIALRVFTTSLDGAEDAATGGAAAALFKILVESEGIDVGRGVWTVDQGTADFHRRGTIYLRLLDGGRFVAVGGQVRFISRGTLCASVTQP